MEIRAPLSGVVVPLDAVPDPVFAQKLVGDGVSIDPTSDEVLAPISGKVTQFHYAHHALAITADNGVEVLVHVGLDTVSLKGKGFVPLVSVGTRVTCGQPVLRFDAEVLARTARSLLTEVIITSGDRVATLTAATGYVEAGTSTLLVLELFEPAAAAVVARSEETVESGPVLLPNPAGLHARPAAVLASQARKHVSEIRLVRGAQEANAKSVVAIMALATQRDDQVTIRATGADAADAAEILSRLLAEGCGERAADAPQAAVVPLRPAARDAGPVAGELSGTPVSPGLAIGRVVRYRDGVVSVPEHGGDRRQERTRLDAAILEAVQQLEALKRQVAIPSRTQILDVHIAVLEDPDLVATADGLLDQGKSAAFSWLRAFSDHAARLEQLDSRLLRERAADVRDVGRRVLGLLGDLAPAPWVLPDDAIVVAEEITPSTMIGFDRNKLRGLCTTQGSPSSHVSILARGLGIPAICGIDGAALLLVEGTSAVIDGSRGLLRVEPDHAFVSDVEARIADQAAVHAAERAAALEPAQTRDGHRVEVVANIRSLDEAREAVAAGAEGVGLLRSEFLFFDRDTAPGEDEQAATYRAIAETLGKERPFVIRTLDVGGDKPLAYLPLPREANPFLGLRGIRVSLQHPDVFRTQLRAILQAAPAGRLHVMFPMISGLDDVRAAKQILSEELRGFACPVQVGAMIEVPSAVAMAEDLARELDFFSIGTNDLTQYALAMDRGHPALARQADALHPAVLRMIRTTVEGARKHRRWVGVCGGIASDPQAVPVLVGLGVDELSVSIAAIASVKAALARWTRAECHALATEVLRLGTTAEVRALLAVTQPGTADAPRPTGLRAAGEA